MRSCAFLVIYSVLVICHFINGYSCAETSDHTEKDISIGVCPVYGKDKVSGITKKFNECCDGYYQERNTNSTALVCKPICKDETNSSPTSDDCVNGICTAPDVCTCNDGFERKNSSSFVCHEKCKNGYIHDIETSECVPYCDGGCVNGRCVEPNKCECNQGYNVTDRNKPNECQCDVYCAEVNGTCECLHKDQRIDGVRIHNNTLSLCNATTSVNETLSHTCGCLNGFYTTNGTCICANGYKMLEGFADLCEPDCGEQCNSGICIEPNTCLCNSECIASALTAENKRLELIG